MSTTLESRYAVLALRVLLEPDLSRLSTSDVLTDMQWDVFLKLAQKQVILIRSYEKFKQMGIWLSDDFCEAVVKERERIRRTVELIGKLCEICNGTGIEFVFTKAFQHYPDMGHDVDLFVQDRSRRVDVLIAEILGSSDAEGSLVNRISGKAGYMVGSYPSPVEIHHGRMGHIGEHNTYPDFLLRNRMDVSIGEIKASVPSPEDQLIIQVMQRIYGHMFIRLSDAVSSIKLIQNTHLDWDYVVETTRCIGIFEGLCHYLSYVDQIFYSALGKGGVPVKVRGLLVGEAAGKVRFKNGYYGFPTLLVGGKLYLRKFIAELRHLNWESIGRLCLLPPLAAYIGLRNVARR